MQQATGLNEKAVLLASLGFSLASLAANFWGGVATEQTRAELAREVAAPGGAAYRGWPQLAWHSPFCS